MEETGGRVQRWCAAHCVLGAGRGAIIDEAGDAVCLLMKLGEARGQLFLLRKPRGQVRLLRKPGEGLSCDFNKMG
jgi:hypothetical protein